MNRKQRRAEAAKTRAAEFRGDLIGLALTCMAARNDPTVTGATLFLPNGEVVHLPASAVQDAPETVQ